MQKFLKSEICEAKCEVKQKMRSEMRSENNLQISREAKRKREASFASLSALKKML
jgi:hypothetical protein